MHNFEKLYGVCQSVFVERGDPSQVFMNLELFVAERVMVFSVLSWRVEPRAVRWLCLANCEGSERSP